MRGYFSSDGGATWSGVDLPLPPAIGTNGYDFGSDPGVAWDLHGNRVRSSANEVWSLANLNLYGFRFLREPA